MKKVLSLFIAVLMLISAVSFSAFAEVGDEKIVIELRSDIAGMTIDDYKDFAIIKSDNIIFDENERSDPVLLTDCVGRMYSEKMKPGRVYTICYTFYAAEGFEIPDEMNEENIEIICGKGVNSYWHGKTFGTGKDGKKLTSLSVWTEVKVDGNFFQNVFGAIADLFLKISAWSPY